MQAPPFWMRHSALRNIAGHWRLLICIAIGLGAAAASARLRIPAPGLVGWNSGVLVYLAISARVMMRASEQSIRRRAALIDESRFIVLALAMTAVLASFIGLIVEMREIRELAGLDKALRAGFAGLTIIASWVLIHTIFAQHYAHEYFIERSDETNLDAEDRAGLRFPGERKPDYLDFMYFSFVIGVAAQTADVAITTRAMRRLNLLHCVLSFFFNATVLALTINLAASLIADGGK